MRNCMSMLSTAHRNTHLRAHIPRASARLLTRPTCRRPPQPATARAHTFYSLTHPQHASHAPPALYHSHPLRARFPGPRRVLSPGALACPDRPAAGPPPPPLTRSHVQCARLALQDGSLLAARLALRDGRARDSRRDDRGRAGGRHAQTAADGRATEGEARAQDPRAQG